MSTTSKWFDRQFDFNLDNGDLPAVIHRLKQSPVLLEKLVKGIEENKLEHQPGGKWSIKEHVGHLCVLELLWQQRIQDFKESKAVLAPADLDNKATIEGRFNDWEIVTLAKKFTDERMKTIRMLEGLSKGDEVKTSIHPRLKQPMRIIDHLYFAAEHDQHHLEKIREIIGIK